MKLCFIELNDSEILLAAGGQICARSPGYAVLHKHRIDLGAKALAQAHRHPRETINRFWHELNQAPLGRGVRYRHHADLAYLHLEHLRELAGKPDAAMFAVPGGYTRDQLALLLGIAQACRLRTIGLLDGAVAGAATTLGAGEYTHVDLQQHQAVITQLLVDSEVRRRAVEVVPDLGLNRFNAACVALIAAAFIAQSRLDPLDYAATEQLLYDHLPEWLGLLATRPELKIHVDFRGARFEATVTAEAVISAAAPLLRQIQSRMPANTWPVMAARVAGLPGCARVFPGALALPEDAVVRGCEAHQALFTAAHARIGLTTELPAAAKTALTPAMRLPPRAEGPPPGAATHILVNHIAYRVTPAPLFLAPRSRIGRERAVDATCRVFGHAGGARLEVLDGAQVLINGAPVTAGADLKPGDHITFGGAGGAFVPISIQDSDAQ